jgi:myosin V
MPTNGELTNGAAVQPPQNGPINLVSSKKPKRRSAGAEPREIDRFSAAYNPRPVSMAVTGSQLHRQNFSGSTFMSGVDNVEFELENLLADEDGLNDEVTMGLIRNLKIPAPNDNTSSNRQGDPLPVVLDQPCYIRDVEQRVR